MPVKKAKKKKPTNVIRSRGRPTKYKPEYCQAIIDYFDIPATDSSGAANDLPFILNFCQHIGISKDCLHKWIAKYPDFNDAYRIAKGKQEQHLITNTLQNRYNASFAWRAAMNMFQWRDQQHLQHGFDEQGLNVLLAGMMDIDPERAAAVKKELIAIALKKKEGVICDLRVV